MTLASLSHLFLFVLQANTNFSNTQVILHSFKLSVDNFLKAREQNLEDLRVLKASDRFSNALQKTVYLLSRNVGESALFPHGHLANLGGCLLSCLFDGKEMTTHFKFTCLKLQ